MISPHESKSDSLKLLTVHQWLKVYRAIGLPMLVLPPQMEAIARSWSALEAENKQLKRHQADVRFWLTVSLGANSILLALFLLGHVL